MASATFPEPIKGHVALDGVVGFRFQGLGSILCVERRSWLPPPRALMCSSF